MSKQILSWVSADPERFYSLKGTGFSDKFEFRRSQSVDNAAFLLALKTGLSGLPAYAGRTVTVTGSFPNAVTVEFSGSTDAVMLVPDGGVTDAFTVVNGVGNYTVNTAAPVTLGVAEAAFQANQRALGGQLAGVVAKGSSVANAGPGQIDSFSGSGPFPAVNGITPNVEFADSEAIRAVFETDLRIKLVARLLVQNAPDPAANGYYIPEDWDGSFTVYLHSSSNNYSIQLEEEFIGIFDGDTRLYLTSNFSQPSSVIAGSDGILLPPDGLIFKNENNSPSPVTVAAPGRNLSALAVAGTFTKAVAGKIASYTLSGAGMAAANGAYTQTAANANPSAGVALYTKGGGVAYIFNNNGVYMWRHGPDLTNAEYYTSQDYPSLAAAVAAGPIASLLVGFNGSPPNPTGTATATSGGTPASINATITYPVSAGNVGAVAIVGAGYTGTTTAPNPNGTADFKLYYPTGATPAAPGVTGTGAAIVRNFSTSQVGLNVAVPGVDSYNYLTAVTSGPIIKDVNAATNLGGTFTLQIASLDTASLGASPASFKSKIQHSDDGVTFTDLVTFDDLTTKTSSTKSVPKTTAIKPYVRFSVTDCVGRWAPSVAFSRQP